MTEVRYDEHGKLTAMCLVDGYVMVRRPHCVPFVLSLEKWKSLSEDHP